MSYKIEKSKDNWNYFIPKRSTSIIQISQTHWNQPGSTGYKIGLAHEFHHYKQWQWAWDKAKDKKPSGLFSCLKKYNRYDEARKIYDSKEKELAAYGANITKIRQLDLGKNFMYAELDRYATSLLTDKPYSGYDKYTKEQLMDIIYDKSEHDMLF